MATSALAFKSDVANEVRLFDQLPHQDDSAREVLEGLRRAEKSIAPKYFYDETGSRLFDQITKLPEYYLTRTEIDIFRRCLGEVTRLIGEQLPASLPKPLVVECGSGSGEKARILIDAIDPQAYVALDISREFLVASTQDLAADFPELDVYAVCADYSHDWALPKGIVVSAPMLAFFPGSSLGNFEPEEAVRFLQGVRRAIGSGGWLLIGVDPPKDQRMLEAAYNDARGVTARFNLNVLAHLNRRFGGNFDLTDFSHEAVYNTDHRRIEMHLACRRALCVRLAGEEIRLVRGERIHTENSYKYSYDAFTEMVWQAGFTRSHHWTDPTNLFSVFLLRSL